MASFEEIIQKSIVCLNMTEDDGQRVIAAMIDAAARKGVFPGEHKDAVVKAVLNREFSASTALPAGIALPHGRTDCVDEIVCVLGIHPRGIAFGAPDNRPTHIFVLLLVPVTAACNHIQFLAKLSRRLMESSVRNDLMTAQTWDDVMQTIVNPSQERNA